MIGSRVTRWSQHHREQWTIAQNKREAVSFCRTRDEVHAKLDCDVQAFLDRGGEITELPTFKSSVRPIARGHER